MRHGLDRVRDRVISHSETFHKVVFLVMAVCFVFCRRVIVKTHPRKLWIIFRGSGGEGAVEQVRKTLTQTKFHSVICETLKHSNTFQTAGNFALKPFCILSVGMLDTAF